VSFSGTHYQLDQARNLPRPVQAGGPKIMIGGGEKRTLRLVARYADMTREMLAAAIPAEETAGFTVGQPHEIPGLVAGHIEAGADEVIVSLPFADAAGITAVGQALGLGGGSGTP
jgi:hypothetical protein